MVMCSLIGAVRSGSGIDNGISLDGTSIVLQLESTEWRTSNLVTPP